MRKFFGFDNTMLLAERVARSTIFLSLIIMMLTPLPIIFICGAGPFAFFYPLIILPGIYTLRGTCHKINLFHFIFLLLCIAGTASIQAAPVCAILLPIFLFCFLIYFQAERRLYYLLELNESDKELRDITMDQKTFSKIYFTNCCKNAVLPTVIGSITGYIAVFSPGLPGVISGACLIICGCIYIFLSKHTAVR